MFVVKIISLILSLQITFAWSSVEDNYFMEYFEDFSTDVKDQIGSAYFQKREAIEVSDEKRFASIFAPVDLLKTAHYWTRHRGRDKYQTNNPPYNSQFTLYTTRASSLNNIVDNKPKRKREIAENFVRLNEISSSRTKREADKDVNLEVSKKPLDKPPSNDTNLSSSTAPPPKVSEAPMDDYANPQLKAPDMRKGDGKRRNVGRQFDRKLNKCCSSESEFPGFNQTLTDAKSQCLVDIRKRQRNFNNSDDVIEGDGGLYNMFSCDRVIRWKSMVTCTIDCVAQKIRMIDTKGVVNVDVAKETVRDNFASQSWEQTVVDALVDKCVNALTLSTSKQIEAYGFQCSSKAAEFTYCMWRELFLTCPVDRQQNSRQCQKLRSVLTKYDDNKLKN